MLAKLKGGLQGLAKLRWFIVAATALYVGIGIMLGHLDYQQGLDIFIRALGL